MNIAETLEYGKSFASARFFGRRIPLVVSVVVTNRCNYSCAYCDRWDGRGERMTTDQLSSMIDDMAALGTRRLIFTGGEPLVRKDIFQLIARARAHEMQVNVNSNGTLVPRFADQLAVIDTLTISIDGDRQIHDSIRGDGAFAAALAAVRTMREVAPHVRVRLTAVISRESIGGEDALLDIARAENLEVFFQPAEHRLLGGGDQVNPIAPPVARYRETIDHLLAEKRAGAPIANSESALRYLRGWPDAPALKCAGARLFVRVDFDGSVKICGRMGEYEQSLDALTLGFRKAFESLDDARCPTCWCASRVEVNQAFSLKPDAIMGLVGG